jgi:hypothetical protein
MVWSLLSSTAEQSKVRCKGGKLSDQDIIRPAHHSLGYVDRKAQIQKPRQAYDHWHPRGR